MGTVPPTLTTLVNFDGANGANPVAGLIADAAGDLFGTTLTGGPNGYGAVFEVTRTSAGFAGTPTVLTSFNVTDGSDLPGGLTADAAGDLFGTTEWGGADNVGNVFEIARSGTGFASTPAILGSFNGVNGAASQSGLIVDSSGDLFGEAAAGGANADGTVFEVVSNGGARSLVTLVSFDVANGFFPQDGLVADASGDLFGTTFQGGAANHGTVFELENTGGGYSLVTLVNFDGTNGSDIEGLTEDSAGDLFGVTYGGGTSGDGTVFELAKHSDGYSLTTLVNFNGANGSKPMGSLIEDAAGNLFGTTSAGGANNGGTVFEVVRTQSGYAGTPTTLVSFGGGQAPAAGLIADAAGDLFGTTSLGGTSGDGTVFELTGTGFQVPVVNPPIISGTIANQPANGAITPFASVTITDAAAGQTETVTITSYPVLAGTLSDLGGGSFSAATGVYTVTGSALAVTAALDGLVFTPAPDLAPAGQTATIDFTINVTDTAGGTASDSTTSLTAPQTSPTYGLVSAYYQAIARTTPAATYVSQTALAVDQGTLTTSRVLSQLLSSAQATTIPALLSYDFMVGVTPSSAGVDMLTNYATDLQTGDYAFSNVFSGTFIGGTAPGEYNSAQFSVLNTYVNFCATDVRIAGNPFAAEFGGLAATPGMANRTTFFQEVYQQIFGVAPAASTTALFVTGPAAADPAITTFQYYVNYAGSELGGYGAVAGVLLYAAESSSPESGPYPGAVNAFLTQAAQSSAAGGDTAPYGSSLLADYPPATSGSATSTSVAVASNAGLPASSVISITGTDQLIDPGMGSHTMRFLAGGGDDTLMPHSGGVDRVSSFGLTSVALDITAVASAANVELNSNVSALGMDLPVVAQGDDAPLRFDPAGQGGGSTVAVWQRPGSTVADTLVSRDAIRLT
jgi:uncharacterized repeat protein (TIGR03803 family)